MACGGPKKRDKDIQVERHSTSSSECERESTPSSGTVFHDSQTDVPTCTSKWDNNHLNQLQITAVLSKAYTPMDIVNSFKIYRLRYDDEVLIDKRVNKISDHLFSCMPSGLQALNFDDFSSVPSKTATSLLYDTNDGTWNRKSFHVPPLPGPPDAKDEYWLESFRVNGDLFSKRLMYMTWLREQDLPVSEHLFQELFQHFSAMFGLDAMFNCSGAPGVKSETLRIGDVKVISTADLVYYDFPNCSHDEGSKIFVVCEVKKDALKNDEEPSPPKTCRYEEGGKQQICHLSSKLIGQHGDRAKFTRGREDDKCLLCETNREDTNHFLLMCPALKAERDRHLSVLKSYMSNNTPFGTFDKIETQGSLVLFILDPSATEFKELFRLKKLKYKDIEAITRTLCYSLHIKRTILNQAKA